MRNRNTVEFLGIWETLHNPYFNPLEFEGFRKEAGLNAFTLSPTRWIEATNAIGIVSQAGRYGGTFAQTDIAFEFASWISVEFRLYLVMEFQRLKAKEQELLGWTAKRELSKINYRIHTDAIKSHLIPEEITPAQASIIYAEEADVLNVAMFGMTAKQWREANPDLKGNIRDYATIIVMRIKFFTPNHCPKSCEKTWFFELVGNLPLMILRANITNNLETMYKYLHIFIKLP